MSSNRFIARRFLPSTTTIALASTELTSDQLIMNAVDAVTQIGDATTKLIVGGLKFNRIPVISQGTRNLIQSMQTFTDSLHELRSRWREHQSNAIVEYITTNTDWMELDNNNDYEPSTVLRYKTVTNTAASEEVLFTIDGNDYTVESLSNLTTDE